MEAAIGRTTHTNSFMSDREVERLQRVQQIIEVYSSHPPLTDRQVAIALGFDDLNKVRPRITENLPIDSSNVLPEEVHLPFRQVGNTKDPMTGRTVRVCTVAWKVPEIVLPQVFRVDEKGQGRLF